MARPRVALAALVLFAVTVAVFAPVSGFEFVNFDDDAYVTENSHVQAGLTTEGLAWALRTHHASNWHPLTWASHMLDCELFGLDAGAHHRTNALLHAAAAALLLLALHALTRAFWPSLGVAALFALHPLRVESVAWLAERKDVLAALFFALTLLVYARHVRQRSRGTHVALLVCAALGLASKPTLVTLPVVLLLLDLWPLGRWSGLAPETDDDERPTAVSLRALVVEKLPLFTLSAAAALATFVAQDRGGAASSLTALPVTVRVSNACTATVHYVWDTLWPTGLAYFYPHPAIVERQTYSPFAAGALAAAVGVVLASALAWTGRRRRPYVFVGWFWFLVMLLPMIGLIQVGEQARADRYTYLSTIGLYLAVAWLTWEPLARRSRGVLWIASAGIVVACCIVATRAQLPHWRDSFALHEEALRVTERNYVAHSHLGLALEEVGRYAEARAQLDSAVASNPVYAEGHNNLGMVLLDLDEVDAAAESLERALDIKPDLAPAHSNLGIALARRGDVDAAIERFERALALDPELADAHNNLGAMLLRRGDAEGAVARFERVVRLAPTRFDAHANLGEGLRRQGRTREALRSFRRALELDPSNAALANTLAWILATDPDPEVRDGREALSIVRRLPGGGRDGAPTFLETAAAAHAELGEFDEAIRLQVRVLESIPPEQSGPARARLAEYRAGRPARR